MFWHFGRLSIAPVYLSQLDESVFGYFQQSFKFFSQAFLLEEQVMIEVKLATVAAGWLR